MSATDEIFILMGGTVGVRTLQTIFTRIEKYSVNFKNIQFFILFNLNRKLYKRISDVFD